MSPPVGPIAAVSVRISWIGLNWCPIAVSMDLLIPNISHTLNYFNIIIKLMQTIKTNLSFDESDEEFIVTINEFITKYKT